MISLRKELKVYLNSIHPRVYFQYAPDNPIYPYIVFDFPGFNDDGEFQEFIVVDIDGWDKPKNGDTTGIESLMESVNSINKKTFVTDDWVVTLYLDRKLPLVDPDSSIKRRKYVYQAKLYKRE
jgi:hypothetical protein